MEVERLQRIKEIEDIQAELPNACVEDLTSHNRMVEVKASALQHALNKLKDGSQGRDELIQKIEELEERQKKAYLRLYERVGTEIDTHMHKSVGMREKELKDEQDRMQHMDANDIVMQNLRQQQDGSK